MLDVHGAKSKRICARNASAHALVISKTILGAMNVPDILCKNLNRLMDKHHEANRRLSVVCHVAEGAIARIRRGEGGATTQTLERLAAHYGLEPWMLLVEDLDPDNPPQLVYPSSEERALYERFKKFLETR